MDIRDEVKAVLDEALSLNGSAAAWEDDTALIGSLPELTSIAVTTVLLALEERFGIAFSDDELDADMFATLGSVVQSVEGKLAARLGA